MKNRTKAFALTVLKLIGALPDSRSGKITANRLGRSGTSVGANYRAACRAKSTADMVAKPAVAEEEADENGFWLEISPEAGLMPLAKTAALCKEADELAATMVASRQPLLRNNRKSKLQNRKSAHS